MKRCAIYVYWNSDGVLESYAEYYISQLRLAVDKVLVVINGKLNSSSSTKISSLGCKYLIRENEGYDFAAYKAGILELGWDEIFTYDELILCNSSVYGPLIPFKDVFFSIPKDFDFWGISQYVGFGWPVHIQSYFYAFRKSLLRSPEFHYYWENLPVANNRDEAIRKYETKLTEHFSRLGYCWTTLIPPSREGTDITINAVKESVRLGTPFIKRKFFQVEFVNNEEKIQVVNMIKKQYPVAMLYEDFFYAICTSKPSVKVKMKCLIHSYKELLKKWCSR